jgi:A/G-specific adenine glycosylase
LLATAQIIEREHGGEFPTTYKELIQLKGIGPYTAAAIASFAFEEAVAVVDGNVFRVLARIYGIEIDITSSAGKKTFMELAQTLLNQHPPSTFNQAIMEFGALHCTPQNPLCNSCPFQDVCLAFSHKKTAILPIKKKKKTSQKRFLHYAIIWDNNQNLIVHQRTKSGIWRGLYEFPLIEMETNQMPTESDWRSLYLNDILCHSEFPMGGRTWSHKLTHQDLELHFWELHLNGVHEQGISVDDLYKLPVPIILHKFMVWNWGNR